MDQQLILDRTTIAIAITFYNNDKKLNLPPE